MNLHALLRNRAADGEPLRVGVIGAGKFGTMFLAQARTTPGIHVAVVADLDESRARRALSEAGFEKKRSSAHSVADALMSGTTHVTEDAENLISADGIDVVVEATGSPSAGVRHALLSFGHGCHVIMVNVEADALVGPLLARRAKKPGWFTRWPTATSPPSYARWWTGRERRASRSCAPARVPSICPSTTPPRRTPYGSTTDSPTSRSRAEGSTRGCSILFSMEPSRHLRWPPSPTPPASLLPPRASAFPPAGTDELAAVCQPRQDGGSLHHPGTVEVVSSLERDGRTVERDLRWGVYVTFKAATDYVARCFSEYGLVTDDPGSTQRSTARST